MLANLYKAAQVMFSFETLSYKASADVFQYVLIEVMKACYVAYNQLFPLQELTMAANGGKI